MLKNNLGYPRVGAKRELKKACEQYWAGSISKQELASIVKQIQQKLEATAGCRDRPNSLQ